jgi:Zn-dependent protease with chaperone function
VTVTLALAVGCLVTSTLALRWLARPLVNRSWPAVAVVVLTVGAVLNAGSLLVVAGLLTLAVAGRWPVVAALGDWSSDALTLTIPDPVVVGLGVRVLWRAGGLIVLLRRSDRLSRRLRAGGAPIVFVDDPTADAFTVAGVRGCVVISRSLFAALGSQERQILIAHELSHLRRRHHLYLHAADLAVAANPALAPLAAAVRLGVERWADEDAAAACGARATAGRALARTALAQAALRRAVDAPPITHPASVLCATAAGVAVRAQALVNTVTPRRSRPLYVLMALLLVTGVLSVCSIVRIHDGFEDAELHPDRVAENVTDLSA